MAEKLKKCPFCGRIPGIWMVERPCEEITDIFGVRCTCKCDVSVFGSRTDAIKAWNTRK